MEVVADEPEFIQGYISLGDLAESRNEKQLAKQYYEKALEIDPLHETAKKKLDRLASN